jgi:hypothetical protein
MVDFLFLVTIGLAALFESRFPDTVKRVFLVFCFGLVGLNLVQAYQYRHYILLGDEMTEAEYWKVFMKTGKKYEGLLWYKYIKPKPEVPLAQGADSTYINDFETVGKWESDSYRFTDASHSGEYATRVDTGQDFSITWKRKIDSGSRDSFVQASVWYTGEYMPTQAALVISIDDNGKVVYWQEVDLKEYFNPEKKWNKAVIQRTLPAPLPKATNMSIFVWNKNSGDIVYLDDMRVDIFERKKR